MKENAAILYHPEGYDTSRGKLMGRHAAGEGFLRGFVQHAGVDRFFACTETEEHFQQFQAVLTQLGSKTPAHWVPEARPEQLAEAGAIFFPGPDLGKLAWKRNGRDPVAYSLTGVTHTICTHRVMDSIGELLTAPVQEWDALICTSPAVKQGVDNILADYAQYLAERFGAPPVRARAQLPVIPLGVDCDALEPGPGTKKSRRELRQRLKISRDELVVLFFGRLSYHAKAHPLPMYVALEAASRATGKKIVLIQAGWFANEPIRRAFEQGAQTACPSVRSLYVDGRKAEFRKGIWHAADIFCSLSDNVQETFGLTPVEAMAAGLPVVASDWDGYRGTVQHDVTGLLVPTLMPAPGSGANLAYRHHAGRDNYDQYIGYVSQSIAVDIGETARAFSTLIGNPELRRDMGEKGKARARSLFDWRVIVNQYQELWADLSARRRAAAANPPAARSSPLRGDPFTVFNHYSTRVLDERTRVTVAFPAPLETFNKLAALGMNSFARGTFMPAEAIQALILRLEQAGEGGLQVGGLLEDSDNGKRALFLRTLGWLCKLGIVTALP